MSRVGHEQDARLMDNTRQSLLQAAHGSLARTSCAGDTACQAKPQLPLTPSQSLKLLTFTRP